MQLKNGESFTEIQVKGNADYKIYNGVPLKPRAGKKCTQCGKCAALCPTNAIPQENPRMTDESQCISCMRCIAVCPQNARKNKSTEIISIYSGFQGKMRNKKKNRNYLYNKTTTLIKRQIQDYFLSNVRAKSGSPLPRKNKYRRGGIFCFLEYNESSPLSSFSHISRLS